MSSSPQLLIFDVNETLLDTKAVTAAINKELGNSEAAGKWFQSLLHYSLVETVTGDFADFSQIADACLEMTAKNYGKDLSAEKREIILSEFKKLSPHSEVFEGLQRLKNAGFIIVALSNGTLETINDQLKYAGINQLFDRIFSIQSIGKFKPHPSTYAYVLDKMEISSDKVLMIAAHPWDLVGASRAGLQTAYIKREGKSNYPLSPKNDFEAENLIQLSNLLIH